MKKNVWKRIQKPRMGSLNYDVSRIYRAMDGKYEVTLFKTNTGREGYVINISGVAAGIRNKSRWIKAEGISMAQAAACFESITYSQM